MEEKKYLGIDIGGTSVKYAVVKSGGRLEMAGSFPSGRAITRKQLLEDISSVIDRAIVSHHILGVGISTLGIVKPEKGEIIAGVENMPAILHFNLQKYLGTRYEKLEISVMNDVHAAAAGEYNFGAGRGCRNFFCITFGTGLGGCAVINSRHVYGAHDHAGEIGFLNYQSKEEYYEKYLATGFVMKEAARRLGRSSISGLEFFALVRQKDPDCMDVFDKWTEKIADLAATVAILLDPERIILGGGISGQGDFLLMPIKEKFQKRLPPEFWNQTEIMMAQCGNNAGILGAVSKWIRE